MKKMLLVLGMITCIFGLSACGSSAEKVVNAKITEEEAIMYADQLVESINTVVLQGMEAQYESDAVITAALESWKAAQEDMGSYQAILDHEVDITEKDSVINVVVDGTIRDAKVEIILDKDLNLTAITTNVQYSLGESMQKATLNTIIGMGTVFVVLILLACIIQAFVLISKVQEKFEKKPEETKKEAVDNTIAQIIETEELTDDLELVAVIAAAVAASEGAASTDGFVVRSIRRANTKKWRNA